MKKPMLANSNKVKYNASCDGCNNHSELKDVLECHVKYCTRCSGYEQSEVNVNACGSYTNSVVQ